MPLDPPLRYIRVASEVNLLRSIALGTIYPLYQSYKVVKNAQPYEELRAWLIFWSASHLRASLRASLVIRCSNYSKADCAGS